MEYALKKQRAIGGKITDEGGESGAVRDRDGHMPKRVLPGLVHPVLPFEVAGVGTTRR